MIHIDSKDLHEPYHAGKESRERRREVIMDELKRNGSTPGFRTPVKQAVMDALDGGTMVSVNKPYHYKG